MGTRSLTYVYDGEEALVCMYRQYDGYPSGHGAELGEFLKDMTIVNGIPVGNTMKIANGADCLAAQMIAHFKKGPGGIYLQSVNSKQDFIDYVYGVYVNGLNGYEISIDIDGCKTLEKCTVAEFIEYCSEYE